MTASDSRLWFMRLGSRFCSLSRGKGFVAGDHAFLLIIPLVDVDGRPPCARGRLSASSAGLRADFHGLGAAGMERTTRGWIHGAGRIAAKNHALGFAFRVRHGHGREQGAGIRVFRVLENRPSVGQFHERAQVHDRHPVAQVPHHGQVVGNEHVGQAEFVLQVPQKIEHLGLDGHIQSRDRLVADHQLGVQGQGSGHGHPLALASGKFVGIALGVGRGQAHQFEQFLNPGRALRPGADPVDHKPLANGRANGLARIEGGKRVLEDHLDLPAQGLFVPLGHGRATVGDGPGVRLLKSQDEAAQGGLSAPGFPHQPQDLAPAAESVTRSTARIRPVLPHSPSDTG